MGVVQKDALRTMIISYAGIVLGYVNKGFLFLIILKTEQIGLINLIYSLGTLFAQFANLGTIYTTWKFFPFLRNENKKHHGFLPLLLLIVMGGIVLCTTAVLVFREQFETIYIEKSPDLIMYYYWLIPIGVAIVFYMVFEMYLRSIYKNIVPVFANEIVLRIALTVILFVYWAKWVDFPTFVALHSLIYFIPCLILVIYMVRIGEFNIRISSIRIPKRFRRIILKFSGYFYVNTLGLILVSSLDVIMVAQYRGLKETGIFSTVLFLVGALQVPYKSIIRVSSPLVSDYWKHRQIGEMAKLYVKVSSVSLTIGLGLFLFCWLNIDFLFSFLKPEFSAGKMVFFYVMLGRIFDMYTGINSSIFTTSKQYRYDMVFTIALILIVYFLNLWLIPTLGMNGAAISTSIAIIVMNTVRVIFVYAIFGMHPLTKNQAIVFGLAVVTLLGGMGLSAYLNDKWISLATQIAIVGIFFLLPVYMFGLDREISGYLNKVFAALMKNRRLNK